MKQRIVTKRQLDEGYYTFANGEVMNHAYRVVGRTSLGDYIVEEPETRPLDASPPPSDAGGGY